MTMPRDIEVERGLVLRRDRRRGLLREQVALGALPLPIPLVLAREATGIGGGLRGAVFGNQPVRELPAARDRSLLRVRCAAEPSRKRCRGDDTSDAQLAQIVATNAAQWTGAQAPRSVRARATQRVRGCDAPRGTGDRRAADRAHRARGGR